MEYYNYTLDLNQPVILHCSVIAVPHPEFQWIQADTMKPLPESSWKSSLYVDRMANSTLIHVFRMSELNEFCRMHVICIATNSYGRSEQHFILLSMSNCYFVPSTPAVTLNGNATVIEYISSTLAIASSNDFINNATQTNNTSAILMIGVVMGAVFCFVTILVMLAIAVCFCKYVYFKKRYVLIGWRK